MTCIRSIELSDLISVWHQIGLNPEIALRKWPLSIKQHFTIMPSCYSHFSWLHLTGTHAAFCLVQMEAIATNDNSKDGKPWLRSVDAVNLNLTQASYTQMTLTGVPASQAEGSSQVPLALLSVYA